MPLKKPIYAVVRYIFHICLIAVPVWLAGHIALWEESRFELNWRALPDAWADWMTLLLLGLAIYFLISHQWSTFFGKPSCHVQDSVDGIVV